VSAPIVPAYFDSALIAKFYLNEPGRDAVRRVAREAGAVVTSGIARAEVCAAFHRKLREGSVTRETYRSLHGQFEHDLRAGLWTVVEPTQALLERAQTLFLTLEKSVFLRSLDALHLVTATSEHFESFYTNDRHLLLACPRLGLRGVDPT
jgi:predicted nucleic acid-binding protein